MDFRLEEPEGEPTVGRRRRAITRCFVGSTELTFKGFNSVLTVAAFLLMGEAMMMYKDWKDSHEGGGGAVAPGKLWFIWSVGACGVYVGLVAAVAFIGVQTKVGLFLVMHVGMMLALMAFEGWLLLVRFVWKHRIPADPTGELEKVVRALETHPTLTKWVGLSLLCIQVASMVLAASLSLMPSLPHDESEDEDELRMPLMHGDKQEGRLSPRGLSHMLTKYGVDTAQIGINPERPQPVIAEEEPSRRGCQLM
eukprot:jgi/Tetstr1/434093/TSEL_023237.t1